MQRTLYCCFSCVDAIFLEDLRCLGEFDGGHVITLVPQIGDTKIVFLSTSFVTVNSSFYYAML